MTEGFSCSQKVSATLKGIRSIFSPCFNFNSPSENLVNKTKDIKRLETLESNWKILIDKVESLEKKESEIVELKSSVSDKKHQEEILKMSLQMEDMNCRIVNMQTELIHRLDLNDDRINNIEKSEEEKKERIGDLERSFLKVKQAAWLSVDIDSTDEEESLRDKN